MAEGLSVAIAAGGTAGHINPALALAEELSARGHEVRFVGQTAKLEGTLVPQAGFELVPIEVSGFDRSRPWTLVSALVREHSARKALARHFESAGEPDVAIGFGAYVELPLMSWCSSSGVPYLLHEQNSVPGLANKTLAGKAARVCISVPAAAAAFERGDDPDHVVLTGNPVRRSVIEADGAAGRASVGVPEDATMLLVFGGSLGAKTLNEGMARVKDELLAVEGLHVVHSTGNDGYEATEKALALTPEEAERWHLMPYISNMGDLLAGCDLVVSRAGASSIAEISALAVPSLLVPYPFATADHQTTNASYLVDAGAAVLMTDGQVATPAFDETLLSLLGDASRRDAMRASARGLTRTSAAAALADQVESVARA